MYDWEWDEDEVCPNDLKIKPGESYNTFDCTRAAVMYFLKIRGETIFFGHVYEETTEGITPVAIQWYENGKVDPTLFDQGYTLMSQWAEPKHYIRYVYVYQENDLIKTEVTEEPPSCDKRLLASQKIILKGS
jgi:hypothetical protein